MYKVIAGLCLLLWPVQVWASGYAVYEWSARGLALGGAMVARDADPSALAFNPSAITGLNGTQIQIGGTAVAPAATMDTAAYDDMDFDDTIWTLPAAFFTHQVSDRYWVGLGMFSRVGLGTEYDDMDTWAGRYTCSHASIQSLSFTPTLAMRLSDSVSIGVGMDATYLNFGYATTIDPTGVKNPDTTDTDIRQEISADGWGYGVNLSARYQPYSWLAFGVLWRSEIQLTVDGDVEFTRKGMFSPSMVGLAKDTGVSGTEPVPESVTFGVMVRPMDRLSLEADAIWTKWSAYKTLTIEYEDPLFGVVSEASSIKNWHDTWRFALGAEYLMTDDVTLRAGYVYDQSPVDDDYEDFAVPCTDRQIVSCGAGWKINPAWTLDVAYAFLWMKDRDYAARDDGTIATSRTNAHAHMLGLSLTYAF